MDIEQKIKKNKPLSNLTTFKIGGLAKFFIEIRTKQELISSLRWAKKNNQKIHILGGGSNILVADEAICGLVLHIKNDKMKVKGDRLMLEAGATLAKANGLAMSKGLSGLEWSLGIPRATLGGAARGNAGAFATDMRDLVETVEVYNLRLKHFELLSKRMCKFSYRSSLMKVAQDYIIWQVNLKLNPLNKAEIKDKAKFALEFRKTNNPQLPSAGSVFENLDSEYIKSCNPLFFKKEIKNRLKRDSKVGAGLIIDLAGLKGKRIGGIMISTKHANHIINTGNGTAKEVITLISFIKQRIRTDYKIQLREEISYFGFN